MAKQNNTHLSAHITKRIKSANTPVENKTLYQKQLDKKMRHSDNLLEQIHVAQQLGKPPFAIVKDILRLRKSPGRLTNNDYFLYQLYDNKKYTPKEQETFISEKLHWPIVHQCCDMTWSALAEDKWLSYNFLSGFDIPVPETLAIINTTYRSFGNSPIISSPDELKQFLQQTDNFPIFAKPNEGLGSFGAFIITGNDENTVLLDQEAPMPYADLFEKVIGNMTYLLQKCVTNHDTLATLTPYVATVRTLNFVQEDSVVTPYSLIKIPSPTNIADNFWREGNYMADINIESGQLQRVIRGKGTQLEEITVHPETETELVGLSLPWWEELKQANITCARLFAPMPYNTTDIAITPNGPVVIEVNCGGSFELPQLASGKGLLTKEVTAFFQKFGWKP